MQGTRDLMGAGLVPVTIGGACAQGGMGDQSHLIDDVDERAPKSILERLFAASSRPAGLRQAA